LLANQQFHSLLKVWVQREPELAEVTLVVSLLTSRMCPAAGRFKTIGRLAFSGLLATGLLSAVTGTPGAQARAITIPPRAISVFYVAGSPNAPTVHAADQFNRVNTSSLGRAVVGGNWTATTGTWTIAANKARTTAATNANTTLNSASIVNGQLEADLTVGSTAEAGLTFLGDGMSNMALLYKKAPGTSQVRLYSLLEFGALPPGPLPAPVATFDVGSTNAAAVKVLINGNVIDVWWNGTPIITYGLSPAEVAALKDAGSSRIGFWAESDAVSRFDNLRLQTLPSQP
jgi:hypothetical protein